MKKVYIVTQGDYSDYHIVAVFDNKEEAQKVVNTLETIKPYYNEAQIEEYTILNSYKDYASGEEDYYIEVTYNSDNKKIDIWGGYWFEESADIDVFEDYYRVTLHLKFTVRNILNSEKIMHDKVAEIEEKFQNDFGGDLKKFREFLNKEKNSSKSNPIDFSEIPF